MSLYINHYPPGEKKKKNLWTKVDSNKNIWLWHQYFDCSLATQQYISSKAYGLLKHGVFIKVAVERMKLFPVVQAKNIIRKLLVIPEPLCCYCVSKHI